MMKSIWQLLRSLLPNRHSGKKPVLLASGNMASEETETFFRLSVDENGKQPPSNHGNLSGRNWTLGWAFHVGSRHVARGQGCEDSIGVDRYLSQNSDEYLNVAVADGISGGAYGNVASAAAANYLISLRPDFPESFDEMHSELDSDNNLTEEIIHVDEVVKEAVARHSARIGATTLAAAWLSPEGHGWICRIGDCRIWHWRQHNEKDISFQQLGEDQDYWYTGETPPPGIPMYNPARMAGNGLIGDPEIQKIFLAPGEGLLLTSDGIHNFLEPSEMEKLITNGLVHSLKMGTVARTMEKLARHEGSHDDVAALILMRNFT